MENYQTNIRIKKKLLSVMMVLTMLIAMIPTTALGVSAGLQIDSANTGADPVTALPASLSNGQVWTDKSVTYNGNGEFTITLKAAGQDYKSSHPLPIDTLDIVLVLDVSTSMGQTPANESSTKLTSMKAAALNAVSTLLSVQGNRIAIVKYGDMATRLTGTNNATAFTTNTTQLNSAINGLTANGYTNIQNAFLVAQQIIQARTDTSRKPVIILMTDGEPTVYHDSLTSHTSSNDHQDTSSGSNYVWWTIQQAMKAKTDIANLSIYTIGFGVGSSAFAVATLMPTAANTSAYRPNVETGTYSAQARTVTQTANFQYNRSGISPNYTYTLVNPIAVSNQNNDIVNGSWTNVNGLTSEPGTGFNNIVWNGLPTKTGNVITNNSKYYFRGTRTGTEYRNVVADTAQAPFNHKYWEDGSSITSDAAAAIMAAFTQIINDLINEKPISKTESDTYTDLAISDVLGNGFEVTGALPAGVTQSGNTITWTLDGDDFQTMAADSTTLDPAKVHSVSFNVKISDSANAAQTYFTNASAAAAFNVLEDNPFYTETGDITHTLTNKGWLALIPIPPTTVTIGITKVVTGPTSGEHTFTFDVFGSSTGGSPLNSTPLSITVNGAGVQSGSATLSLPYSAFNEAGQATLFVQENGTASTYWTFDNGARKPVTITAANPIGSVTFTNAYDPEGTLTVKKAWTGNGSTSNISFDLQKEISAGNWTTVSSGHTILANDTNGVTLSGLDIGVKYRVVETPVQDFTASYSAAYVEFTGSDITKEIVITNDYQTPVGKITVHKIWNDNNDSAGDRPDELVFQVRLDNNPSPVGSLTLNADSDWTGTFETTVFGTYTFTEVVPLDYTAASNPQSQTISISPINAREASLTFTNNYVEPTGTLTVAKEWANEGNDLRFRPQSIELALLLNGEETDLSVTLPENDDSPWVHTFTGLEFGTYSVVEAPVADYTASFSSDVILNKEARAGSITVTNTFDNPTGSITVNKTWVESGVDAAAVRPSAITINLYKDNALVDSFELTGATSVWSHTFDGLALDGTYTVTETDTSGNLSNYELTNEVNPAILSPTIRSASVDLVNTYAKGTLTVVKHWEDGTNPINELPQAAIVTLYQVKEVPVEPSDDQQTPSTEIITTAIGEKTITRPSTTAVFYDLEIGDNIHYYVEEAGIPFYSTNISDSQIVLNDENQNDTITITNTYTDPKGSLTVNKSWVHGNNPVSDRPAEVTVFLFKNGGTVPVDSATFSDSHTFGNLDLGAEYTVAEASVINYQTTYSTNLPYTPAKSGDSVLSGTITITNTYDPLVGNLKVSKEWVGKTGEPITITLKRSIGAAIDSNFALVVELSEDNQWQHTFTGLELYGPNGAAYTYSAVETGSDLSLYAISNPSTPTLTADETASITITNTYTPNKGTLTIHKAWVGADEGDIPENITVKLLIDGTPEEGTMILDAENNWSVTRSGLDVEKTYSVIEVDEFEEFDVTYSSDSITFSANALEKAITITNTRTEDELGIQVTKTANNPSVQLLNGQATFSFSLEIVNTGNRTLRAVEVNDLMTGPSGATLAYSPAPSQGTPGGAIYDLDDLKPGASATLTYSVTVDRAGQYSNVATATGYYREEPVSDNDDAATTATNPPPPESPTPSSPPSTPTPAQGSVTISYVDENGASLSPSFEFTGSVGTNYVTTSRTIEGYTLTQTPANATGTFINGNIPVVYVYTSNTTLAQQGTVIVSYVDENGAALLPNDQASGNVGSNYTTTAEAIDGYTLTGTPANASGTFTSGTISVVYIYSQNEDTETDIGDETTPQGGDVTTPAPDDGTIVLDEEVPQAAPTLPKTGGLPLEAITSVGFLLTAAGIVISRKRRKEENNDK